MFPAAIAGLVLDGTACLLHGFAQADGTHATDQIVRQVSINAL
jgi:hypothetical protein